MALDSTWRGTIIKAKYNRVQGTCKICKRKCNDPVPDVIGDRFDLIHAIAYLTSNYHSGQWSRGYRLWCRAKIWLARHGVDHPLDMKMSDRAQRIYDIIEEDYKDKM
jgi:hypothetical protein